MKLNPLFSNQAVFQRDIPVPVWGETKPCLQIRASIAGKSTRTVSNAEGFFILRLPPLPAGGPYTLRITSNDKKESVTVKDILVGEVWLCSGQSNMEFPVGSSLPDPDPQDCPSIRMITVPRIANIGRAASFDGNWIEATGDKIESFSAVGYYFARRIHAELDIPVGIIHSSWGGTLVEAWTSREALNRVPSTAQMVRDYEAALTYEKTWKNIDISGIIPKDTVNTGYKNKWHTTGFDDSGWETAELPGSFEKCLGRKTNGAFWFRKTVTIPKSWVGQKLIIHVGAADKHDVTYCNGYKVGATGTGVEENFWSVVRKYSIAASRVKTTQLSIAVRVWSFLHDGGLIGPAHEMFVARESKPDNRISLAGDWLYAIEKDLGLIQPPQAGNLLPGNPNSPYTLYDSMIAPLVPYAMRGALWYQGESNAGRAYEYMTLQNNMVADWRYRWGQGDFPFICVQLANFQRPEEYNGASDWAFLREAQLKTTLTCPNAGMATAIDIGEAYDIHPRNKLDVGRRMAQWALANTYNKNIVPNGPHFDRYEIEGNVIRIRFRDTGKGLTIKGSKLKTCFIAGSDRKFVPAEAVIENDTLLVSSPDVKSPQAVRYAWADNPENCNLYNKDGLPASPFRTDTWK
ncbi:MAG: sialate O-acetylesterase [Lentisphaerae bacterium]|jgi:sialate O-acetylesterase|nr:sialate O-acetylesterase [Lentisphaerota bacterium]